MVFSTVGIKYEAENVPYTHAYSLPLQWFNLLPAYCSDLLSAWMASLT